MLRVIERATDSSECRAALHCTALQMTIRAKTKCQLILFNVYSVRDMAEQNKVGGGTRTRPPC